MSLLSRFRLLAFRTDLAWFVVPSATYLACMGRAEVVFLASPLTFRYGTFAWQVQIIRKLQFNIGRGVGASAIHGHK
ncbi:hypothetical protein F5X97DRAFT_301169 [Nemania serpens]|nr:hypothetical protein F5X97DRAFT_301169 [Nemania serpens]